MSVKVDSSGNEQWSKTYADGSLVYCVVQANDGGYAMGGYTLHTDATSDIYLVKTDASGNMQWNKTYGSTGDEGAQCVIKSSDGGYVIAGSTTSYGSGGSDMFLVKTDVGESSV